MWVAAEIVSEHYGVAPLSSWPGPLGRTGGRGESPKKRSEPEDVLTRLHCDRRDAREAASMMTLADVCRAEPIRLSS